MRLLLLQLVQLGGSMSAQQAGALTLGYAVAIIAFIRVGEKLLQRFGARKPMIWGCLITGLAIVLLSPANLMLADYKVLAMIDGALKNSRADVAIAVTGIAGPGGGSEHKPVGLVHIAVGRRGGPRLHEEHRFGDIGRHRVQAESAIAAFALAQRVLD